VSGFTKSGEKGLTLQFRSSSDRDRFCEWLLKPLTQRQQTSIGLPLKSRYRFDSLIETEGMRVAKGVCLGIAKSGKTVLNPVYIYGAPGCGKTHLLQATCTAAIEDDRKAVYLTGEAFLNLLSEHRGTATSATRLLQESADILCVDDIPFLESHPRSSAVLADLIQRLMDAGKPVLLAGQCKPTHLKQALASLYRVIRKGVVLHIGELKEEEKRRVAEELAKRFSVLTDLSCTYQACHTVGEILSLLLQTDEKDAHTADLIGALTERIATLFGEDAPVAEISFYALRKVLGLKEAKRIVLNAETARAASLSRKARTFIENNTERRNKFHQLLRFLEQQCKLR